MDKLKDLEFGLELAKEHQPNNKGLLKFYEEELKC